MHLSLPIVALLGLAVPGTATSSPAQAPPTQSFPQSSPATTPAAPTHTPRNPPLPPGRQTVFIDPAHGGEDSGARLPGGALEKDVTLALSNRLRAQLTSLGLIAFPSRDADTAPPTPTQPNPSLPTADQRAGIANHLHPFACIVLHATGSGSGVHVITAALQPPPNPPDPGTPTPWDSAQLDLLPQSARLASSLAESLDHAGLHTSRSQAVIRPLISLTCPAVLIELAPLSRSESPTSSSYQARAVQAIATALLLWHNATEPASTTAPDPPASSDTAAPSPDGSTAQ